MAVLKWSRLEEEVDVTSLPDNQARSGGWNLVRNLGASLALLVLVLFLVISRSEQQGLNQTLEITLNSTIEKAVRLRDELQEVGERVNSANSEVANLRASLARLSTAKPWTEELDKLEDKVDKELGSATKERAEVGGNITLMIGSIAELDMKNKNLTRLNEKNRKDVDNLKREVQVQKNSSDSLAALVHSRLDIVERKSQDLSFSQSGLEKNLFSRIAALQFR